MKEAGPDDQVFIQPGTYEDQLIIRRRPIRLVGAGMDQVQIVCRRGGPCSVEQVPEGLISGITFRYLGSEQYPALHLVDSSCTITACRLSEGILSGIVLYGPEAKPTIRGNEVCHNRESGIFIFGGAHPYVAYNTCYGNYHFGIAVRDRESCPDIVRNTCRDNMLSGILLFQCATAMVLENHCHGNQSWGCVITPDATTTPLPDQLAAANTFAQNPRGDLHITRDPLIEIGR